MGPGGEVNKKTRAKKRGLRLDRLRTRPKGRETMDTTGSTF